MIITLLTGVKCTPDRGKVLNVSPAEFLDALADEEETESIECKSEEDKKKGPGFILAEYRKGAKSKEISELSPDSTTEIFCFDIDNMSVSDIRKSALYWTKYDSVVYSTYKHCSDSPRLRLLVHLDTPVTHKRPEYLPLYLGAAKLLRIKVDKYTKDVARFFFGPQHKPEYADERERWRFRGAPMKVSEIERQDIGASDVEEPGIEGGPGERPTKKDLALVAKGLKKAAKRERKLVGVMIEALLRGESFAASGSRHGAIVQLTLELARFFPFLDSEWFANTYMTPIWALWGADLTTARGDWARALSGARALLASGSAKARTDREAVVAEDGVEVVGEALERVKELRGKIVCSYRSSYYVFYPYDNMFRGPYRAPEVPTVFRELLGGVPGITEKEFGDSGRWNGGLKSAARMTHEYGSALDNVFFYSRSGPAPYLPEHHAICIQAYTWNEFDAVWHDIVWDLMKTIAGDDVGLLEAYFWAFRNLDQPLPALTLVGPRGTWKSRVCQTLSRFWGNPHAASANKARKIMTRFNGGLLKNPVIWSDEQLAREPGVGTAELYRESISERVHEVEMKGAEVVTLFSAVRHVIAVNDVSKVFSEEFDAASIEATMERFLTFEVSGPAMEDFESRWAGTDALERLRDGESLLEHIVWIENNRKFEPSGRLFVATNTNAEMLLAARFADETLFYCWLLAFESLSMAITSKAPMRSAIFKDAEGNIRLNPSLIQNQWNESRTMARTALRAPSPQRIGQLLSKSGFKLNEKERASKNASRGWRVNENTLRQFLEVEDLISWDELSEQLGLLLISIGPA